MMTPRDPAGQSDDPSAPKADPDGRATGAARQKDRLKAALKANMARRKHQARARAGQEETTEE